MVEWQKWLHTYYLRYTHTEDDDTNDNTLIFYSIDLDQQLIVKDVGYELESNNETTLELDSHANTCVLGRDALIILDYQ